MRLAATQIGDSMSTLQELLDESIEELKSVIVDNHDESHAWYQDEIFRISDENVPQHYGEMIDVVSSATWIMTTTPEVYDGSEPTAYNLMQVVVMDYLRSELERQLSDLRDDLTPECDDCGKRFKDDDLHLMEDDAYVCSDCSGDHIEPD